MEEQVATETDTTQTVSVEAHNRVKQENEALKAQVAELGGTIKSYAKRDKARDFMRSQGVEDPDAWADLVTPHLSEVEPDQVGDFLAADRFKGFVEKGKAGAPAPAVSNGEGGEGAGEPPVPEPAGFGGPSPGGEGGQPIGTQAPKIKPGTPEYQQLLGDDAALKRAYDEGRISEPARPW